MNKKVSLVLIVVLSPIVWFAYTVLNKAYWDRKVTELCLTEGGVTIYEKVGVRLSEHPGLELRANGTLYIPLEILSSPNDRYITRSTTSVLSEKEPRVRKFETVYVDREGEKVLARAVFFSRVGGDLPFTTLLESAFSCTVISGFDETSSNKANSIISILGE